MCCPRAVMSFVLLFLCMFWCFAICCPRVVFQHKGNMIKEEKTKERNMKSTKEKDASIVLKRKYKSLERNAHRQYVPSSGLEVGLAHAHAHNNESYY